MAGRATHSDTNPKTKKRQITLFTCSGCEACERAATFLQGWCSGRQDVTLEIVSILEQPEAVVRLGINYTPALVIEGVLRGQNVSTESLADLLQ